MNAEEATVQAPRGPLASANRPLSVALLTYRGNPRSGGQGVYVRHLSKELTELGHDVTVFSGQPYPLLDRRVRLVPVPSLDLYREHDPFRLPKLRELQNPTDLLELLTMWTGGLGEPRTFARRVYDELSARMGEFDVVHDNQCLGTGILKLARDGVPLVASIHHPVVIDRDLELSFESSRLRALSLRRWYGFCAMQARVARQLPRILTVSSAAKADICARIGVLPDRVSVVPVGVDREIFHPGTEPAVVPGRIMAIVSADIALKGLLPLVEALAKVRTEFDEAHLVVVGKPRPKSPAEGAIDRLGLRAHVRFVAGASDEAVASLYRSASLAVVPSLYEGFSLPAVQAMACGVPLVATTGGALPEVVGEDGDAAVLVPPGDSDALAQAMCSVLSSKRLRAHLSTGGVARVGQHFTWRATAEATASHYEEAIGKAAC